MLAWVYVLHFEEKIAHAGHYCGVTMSPRERIGAHRAGAGARLTQVAKEKGIVLRVGAIGHMEVESAAEAYEVERRMKAHKNTRDFCVLCMGERARRIAGTTPGNVEAMEKWLRFYKCGRSGNGEAMERDEGMRAMQEGLGREANN